MFPHNAEVRNKMTVSECRRESGVVPATTIPTTDRTQAIKQLNEAVKEMARQMLGQGEQIEWTLDIKSMSSKKENVHLNGPMEL